MANEQSHPPRVLRGEFTNGRPAFKVFLGRPSSDGGGVSLRPYPAFFDPERQRLTIPRALAFGMLLGFADMGDHGIEVPFDDVAFLIPTPEGTPFLRGTVVADISDELCPEDGVALGMDIINLGDMLYLDTESGRWQWNIDPSPRPG